MPIAAARDEPELYHSLSQIHEACITSIKMCGLGVLCSVGEALLGLSSILSSTPTLYKKKWIINTNELRGVWTELQDIHDAHGLRYQWGGSHSNKKLLCSLGIDTRNILFTGNKKQPVIVPMYAAGLGMLEPTKEPLKPLSAAEKIASIGQTTVMTPEINTCTSDPFQVLQGSGGEDHTFVEVVF